MLVICDSCESNFQFDDFRIPSNGIKVRCSKCGHVFMVKREIPEDFFSSYEQFVRHHRNGIEKKVPRDGETATSTAEEVTHIAEEPTGISFEKSMSKEKASVEAVRHNALVLGNLIPKELRQFENSTQEGGGSRETNSLSPLAPEPPGVTGAAEIGLLGSSLPPHFAEDIGSYWMENRLLSLKKELLDIIWGLRIERQKRVLIVEDESRFRGALQNFVESLGYVCAETDSAHSALEILERTHFPIIVLDIVIPEIDALELLRSIKKRYPDVDVLVITGNRSRYSPAKVIEAGASDFLTKPFRREHLSARLGRIERDKAIKKKLYSVPVTDELTGLHNWKHFSQKLKWETDRAKRQGHSVSVVLLDVDGFKVFNDRYGRVRGEALLKTVARVLRLSIREHVDCAFRHGGDKFVLILPEADDKTALSIGKRIKAKFKATAPDGLSLTIGVAEYRKDFGNEGVAHLLKDKQKNEILPESQPQGDLQEHRKDFHCMGCGRFLNRPSCFCEWCLSDARKESAPAS